MVVHRNTNVIKFIYFPDVELDAELVRLARLMSYAFLYTTTS